LVISQGLPKNLLTDIRPVLDLSPRANRVINFFADAIATGTVATTSTTKDTYITNINVSGAKVVGDSGTALFPVVTVGGTTKVLFRLASITLTQDFQHAEVAFNPPIKLDRGKPITLSATGAWTLATMHVQGYEVIPSP
jgi:hypothetical protein